MPLTVVVMYSFICLVVLCQRYHQTYLYLALPRQPQVNTSLFGRQLFISHQFPVAAFHPRHRDDPRLDHSWLDKRVNNAEPLKAPQTPQIPVLAQTLAAIHFKMPLRLLWKPHHSSCYLVRSVTASAALMWTTVYFNQNTSRVASHQPNASSSLTWSRWTAAAPHRASEWWKVFLFCLCQTG